MTSVNARVVEFLNSHRVINLAYADLEGKIQCCALWYAADAQLNLYVLSSLSTQHGKALQSGGEIAFTINKDQQHWKSITGVQGRGRIRLLDADHHAFDTYAAKFSFILEQFSGLEAALEETRIWKIRPTWVRLIDNSLGFGHKDELELS